MVVDDVENDGDASAMAGPHEVLELIAAAAGIFDGEIVGGGITPAEPILEFCHRHQLDGVDPQVDQIIQQADGVLQRARVPRRGQDPSHRRGVRKSPDPRGGSAADDRHRIHPARSPPRKPAAFRARPLRRKSSVTRSGSTTTEQLLEPSRSSAPAAPGGVGLRVDTTPADLAAGIEVGAIGHRAIILSDPEHVRGVIKGRKTGKFGWHRLRLVVQMPSSTAVHGNNGRNPPSIVIDIPSVTSRPPGLAADQFHIAGLWRPHRKTDRRGSRQSTKACWRPACGNGSGNTARSGRSGAG